MFGKKKREWEAIEPSLLTMQDYIVYRKLIKPLDKEIMWWLRDAGYGDKYNYVACYNGTFAGREYSDSYYVRPVIYVLYDTNPIGATIELHGHTWTKLRDRKVARHTNRSLFICNEVLDETVPFSKINNKFEETDFKSYLHSALKLPRPKPKELTEEDKRRLKMEQAKANKKELARKAKQAKIDAKLAKKKEKEELKIKRMEEREAKRREKEED